MFESLKQFDVDPAGLVPFELTGVRRPGQKEDVILHVCSASLEANDALLGEAMRTIKGRKQLDGAGGAKTAAEFREAMTESLDRDRELYAGNVVRGWEHVSDDAGTVTPFTRDNCVAFLRAMPDWMFKAVREFCGDERNFTRIALSEQIEAVAGN